MQKAQPDRAVEVVRQFAAGHHDGRIVTEGPCAAAIGARMRGMWR
jgi:hypothetical protein